MRNSNDIVGENRAINNVCGADIVFFRNNLHIETIEKIKTDLESADRGEVGTILIPKLEKKTISLDEYIDKTLADIGYEGYNHSSYIELLCDLIDDWFSNYSLYDLFFNNENFNVRSKDKKDLCEKINILLEFNVFEYKEKYKKVYEKIDEILENENKNNISSMQLLISTKKQATQDYNELNDDYSGLRRKTMVDDILHKIESSMQISIIEDLSQQINTSKKPLTPEEQIKILNEIFGQKEVSDLRFLYCGDGGEGYSGFETENNDNEYIFTKIGLGLIRDNERILSNYLGDNIFDFGCGNGRKGKILIEAHKKIFGDDNEKSYIPIDISPEILNSIKENFTTEECGEGILVFDADSQKDSITKRVNGRNTYLFLGGTIGNFSDEGIIEILQKTFGNDSLHPTTGNYLIFDYFTPPKNEEELKNIIKSYAGPDGKQWLINGLKQLGIPENIIKNFTHVVRYVSEDGSLCAECIDLGNVEIFGDIKSKSNMPGKILEGFMFMADEDFSLNKLSDGTKINPPIKIEKGKFYPLNISRRFSENKINSILKRTGYRRKKLKGIKQGEGMNIAVAMKPGEKYLRYKKYLQTLFMTTLLLGSIIGFNNVQGKKKFEEQKNEVISRINSNKQSGWEGYKDGKSSLWLHDKVGYDLLKGYEKFIEETLNILESKIDFEKSKEKNIKVLYNHFNEYIISRTNKIQQEYYNNSGDLLYANIELSDFLNGKKGCTADKFVKEFISENSYLITQLKIKIKNT